MFISRVFKAVVTVGHRYTGYYISTSTYLKVRDEMKHEFLKPAARSSDKSGVPQASHTSGMILALWVHWGKYAQSRLNYF